MVLFLALMGIRKIYKRNKKKFNEPENNIINYLSKAKKKYDLTKSIFLEQSLNKLKTYLSKNT